MSNRKTAPREQGAESNNYCRSAKVIEVIEVVTKAGRGTEQDPNRIVTEYWSLDGKLLVKFDPNTNLCEHQLYLD